MSTGFINYYRSGRSFVENYLLLTKGGSTNNNNKKKTNALEHSRVL